MANRTIVLELDERDYDVVQKAMACRSLAPQAQRPLSLTGLELSWAWGLRLGPCFSHTVLDSWQDHHPVITNTHLSVTLAAWAAEPGPLHRHDLRVHAAPNEGGHQAADPATILVRAGHRK
jgi:hypothetical protein